MTAWSFSQSTVRTDTTSSQRDSAEVPPKRTKSRGITYVQLDDNLNLLHGFSELVRASKQLAGLPKFIHKMQ